jgi:hypothetical protein
MELSQIHYQLDFHRKYAFQSHPALIIINYHLDFSQEEVSTALVPIAQKKIKKMSTALVPIAQKK